MQTSKTEADRFAEILKEEGVTATILKERYATHSNQNAENVGALLKARGVSPDWVVCFGTPEAVGRQTRSYVKFMGRDPAKGATFVSGPRAPNERRDSVTDPLFSLRECATLLSLSHNTDFFPSGRDFGSPADYQDGMLKSGRAAGEALLSFSKMLLQHLEEGRLPSERVTSHLFSDPSDKAAGTFTLEALARSWIAFSQSPGWQALGDGDHALPEADRRMLRRTQVVLGELFSAREDGFDRD